MHIIGKIKSQEPPGKFIEKNLKTGTWHEVDDKRAYFKTSQALRERVRQHADKRSRSPELQKKVDEMQNFCANLRHRQHKSVACISQEKDICGLAEGSTISNIIPESSRETDFFCINELNYAEKYSPHRYLHGLSNSISSLQDACTDRSDALCEALLAKFIRENLSYDEDEAKAGSLFGANFC
jgi:hypothetical protein